MNDKTFDNKPVSIVPVFKALADETRLEIIRMLTGGELCAGRILEHFKITQPTLSYHMKILTDCGIVIGTRDGAWMRYSLNPEAMKSLCSLFRELCRGADGENKNTSGQTD
jgi:ArsR family transcriptional regulator